MNKKYFQTRSKTLAYALNYIGYSFYKFDDVLEGKEVLIYSFETDADFYDKLEKLNDIRFS